MSKRGDGVSDTPYIVMTNSAHAVLKTGSESQKKRQEREPRERSCQLLIFPLPNQPTLPHPLQLQL